MIKWGIAGLLGWSLWFLAPEWRPVAYTAATVFSLFLLAFIEWGDEGAKRVRQRFGAVRLYFVAISGAYALMASVAGMPTIVSAQ